MIRLRKNAKPRVLEANGTTWTTDLLETINSGTDPSAYLLSRYAHPEIKAALLVETSGKCAYCESKFRHVTYGDIEHIVSKDSAPELRFEWENLTAACDVCNTNKGSALGLVDPYANDPSEIFRHLGPLMFSVANHAAGLLTEARLRLNRAPLVERRSEKVQNLQRFVRTIERATGDVRDALIELLHEEAASSSEYSACASAAIAQFLEGLGRGAE